MRPLHLCQPGQPSSTWVFGHRHSTAGGYSPGITNNPIHLTKIIKILTFGTRKLTNRRRQNNRQLTNPEGREELWSVDHTLSRNYRAQSEKITLNMRQVLKIKTRKRRVRGPRASFENLIQPCLRSKGQGCR